MISRILVLVICFCWLEVLNAETPQPLARISLEPHSAVWTGQPLTLEIDVLVPNWFTRGLDLSAIQIPGVAILMSCRHSFNYTERIQGMTFAAQKRSFVVIPQRAGLFHIPALNIKVTYAAGDSRQPVEAQLRLPPQSFRAVAPPTPPATRSTLVANSVSIEQSFDRPLTGLKVGDALQRTLTVYGKNTLGAMLPALRIGQPQSGVKRYDNKPLIRDDCRDREGLLGGERIERYTYIMQAPGTVTLPEIDLAWFNPQTKNMEKVSLAALTWEVAAAETPNEGILNSTSARWIILAVIFAAALGLFAFSTSKPSTGFKKLKKHWQRSEYYHYWRLRRACRANNCAEAYTTFQQWWQITHGQARYKDNIQPHIEALSLYLYSETMPREPWRGKALLNAVKKSRHSKEAED